MTACACLGPMYGEPVCPCRMVAEKRERSQAYKDAHTPEALQEQKERLSKALSKVFGWDEFDSNEIDIERDFE